MSTPLNFLFQKQILPLYLIHLFLIVPITQKHTLNLHLTLDKTIPGFWGSRERRAIQKNLRVKTVFKIQTSFSEKLHKTTKSKMWISLWITLCTKIVHLNAN